MNGCGAVAARFSQSLENPCGVVVAVRCGAVPAKPRFSRCVRCGAVCVVSTPYPYALPHPLGRGAGAWSPCRTDPHLAIRTKNDYCDGPMSENSSGGVEEQRPSNGRRLGGCTGKGFKPGQSGNPGGRPRSDVASLARQHTSEAIAPWWPP
jgi:hypothetical protein